MLANIINYSSWKRHQNIQSGFSYCLQNSIERLGKGFMNLILVLVFSLTQLSMSVGRISIFPHQTFPLLHSLMKNRMPVITQVCPIGVLNYICPFLLISHPAQDFQSLTTQEVTTIQSQLRICSS